MATDGTLSYALKLSNKGFTGPLGSAGRGLGKFIGKAGAAGGALVGLGGTVGGLAMTLKSLDKAAELESLQTALSVILESDEAAQDLLDTLLEFSASTPFQFATEIAPLSRLLINAGVAAKDMKEELFAIGNIAAGSGKSILQIGEIYAKALQRGKVQGEILESFAIAGVPILDMLAEAMGRGREEVTDLGSQGVIAANDLRQAFRLLGGETGKWGAVMKRTSQDNKGLISTLKDNIDQVMIAFGQPINDALKPILADAIAMAKDLKDDFADLGKRVGGALEFGYQAAKHGLLGDLIAAELKLAGAKFINYLSTELPAAYGVDTFPDLMSLGMEKASKTLEEGLLRAGGVFVGLLGDELKVVAGTFLQAMGQIPGLGDLKGKGMQLFLEGSLERPGGPFARPDTPFSRAADEVRAGKEAVGEALTGAINDFLEGRKVVSEDLVSALEDEAAAVRYSVNWHVEKVRQERKAAQEEKDDRTNAQKALDRHNASKKRETDAVDKSAKALDDLSGVTTKAAAAAAKEQSRTVGKLRGKEESAIRRGLRRSPADQAPSDLDTFFRDGKAKSDNLLRRQIARLPKEEQERLRKKFGDAFPEPEAKKPSRLDFLRDAPIKDIADSDFFKRQQAAGEGALKQAAEAAQEAVRNTVNPAAKPVGKSREAIQKATDALLEQIKMNTEPLKQIAVAG